MFLSNKHFYKSLKFLLIKLQYYLIKSDNVVYLSNVAFLKGEINISASGYYITQIALRLQEELQIHYT